MLIATTSQVLKEEDRITHSSVRTLFSFEMFAEVVETVKRQQLEINVLKAKLDKLQ